MIKHVVELKVPGARAEDFYAFMVDPSPERFRRWLPAEHHAFRVVKRGAATPLGDLVYYDEILGSDRYRLAFHATIVEAAPPNKIVFRMRKFGIDLPAYLDLELRQDGDALGIKHEVRIEDDRAPWKLASPFVKRAFDDGFWAALEGHCHREWPALKEALA